MVKQFADDSPRICIIGAGPCGLTTAKNLLQQGMTNFTVFEKSGQLGGNWVFSEQNTHSSIYETTHIISSRKLSAFEDFPMPEHYPDYPSHKQILSYFESYAAHFGVESFIQYNTCIEQVIPRNDGQWRIIYKNETGQQEATFDYVMVANGHHWDPVLPDYIGQFSGEVLHAHQYKKAASFINKRVLVVGGGNSACDIAVEIARVSANTAISMRRGQHIFPKFIFGKPTDIAFATIRWMPSWFKQIVVSLLIRILQGRYAKYQLKRPNCKPLEIHPTINSELLYFIRHGKIATRHGIDRIDGHDVYFVDDHKEEFDTIIFATGYKISFPFFDETLVDYSQLTHIPLYRKMMHPTFETLYFIGLFQPQGCIWPLADYQASIAARIIAGKLKRPDNLAQKIQRENKKSRTHFKKNIRHALEVDYQTFRQQLLNELKNEKMEKSTPRHPFNTLAESKIMF